MTNIVFLQREPLKALGAVKDAENPKSVCICFNRELTNEEFRFFHETCERTAFLMRGITND